jgi:hypothetical protein
VPLWGVWDGDRLFFGTDPRTRTARNLARNPAVVVHLESGDDVVIVKGTVEQIGDRATVRQMSRLGAAKYGTPAPPEDDDHATGDEGETGAAHVVFALRPHTAYAWRDLTRDATRWHNTSSQ